MALRDLNTITLQKYFSGLRVGHSSALKIKDALSSVLGSAVRFQMLVRNPIEGIQTPPPRTGKRTKPHITPEQFELLVNAHGRALRNDGVCLRHVRSAGERTDRAEMGRRTFRLADD